MDFNFAPLSGDTIPSSGKCGVYVLRCLGDVRIYVGGTEDLQRRLRNHQSCLKGGYHCVPAMNEVTARLGYGNWQWALAEECSPDDLDGRETYWIQQTRCFEPEVGFNTLRSAYGPTDEMIEKSRAWWAAKVGSVVFVSPTGEEEIEVVSRVNFAREIGADPQDIYAVVGGRLTHAKGWALKETQRHTIYDPSGKRYSYVSRNLFRRITGCPANLPEIERRPTWQHHGWSQTLENCLINRPPAPPKPKKIKQEPTPKKPVRLISPTGEVVEFASRRDAITATGGNKSLFYKMITGKKHSGHNVLSYRGWKPVT